MQEEKYNIYNYLRTASDKYTYFLLAASASAIAFAITQTKTLGVSWSQAPLALAVLLWGLSFYFGCKCAQHTQALHQDSAWLYEAEGSMENRPEIKEELKKVLSRSYGDNLSLTKLSNRLQFYFLIAGGVFFVFWHVIEMVLRTRGIT